MYYKCPTHVNATKKLHRHRTSVSSSQNRWAKRLVYILRVRSNVDVSIHRNQMECLFAFSDMWVYVLSLICVLCFYPFLKDWTRLHSDHVTIIRHPRIIDKRAYVRLLWDYTRRKGGDRDRQVSDNLRRKFYISSRRDNSMKRHGNANVEQDN